MSQSSSSDNNPALGLRYRIIGAIIYPIWVFVGFIVAQLGISLILSFLTSVGVPLATVDSAVFTTSINVLVYSLTLLIVIGGPWLVVKQRTSREQLGLHRLPWWRDIVMAPLGYFVYLFLAGALLAIVQNVAPFIDLTQEQDTGFEQLTNSLEYILAFIALVIVAPFAEEILFRGYLFGKLRRFVPVWIAILITSLLFGFVHQLWNVGIDTFALSIVMCLLVVWSGSLWPSILLHMMKNFIAFYFLFINPGLLNTIGG